MVHTRHSFIKEEEEEQAKKLNGHTDCSSEGKGQKNSSESGAESNTATTTIEKKIKGNISNKKECNKDNDDASNLSEKKNEKDEVEPKRDKPAKRKTKKRMRSMLGLYDSLSDTLHRRSLRTITRQNSRYLDDYETGFRHLGSSRIRRSGRQKKKVFDTFNESQIQREIERKHKEMLELQEEASMYDSIKRRRVHSDTQDDEDDSEEDDEEEEEEDSEEEEEVEEEEVGEDHPAYNLRKTKKQTNRYQPPLPSRSKSRRREVMFSLHSPMRNSKKMMKRIPQHASSPRHKRRRRTSSTSSSDDEDAFERRKAKSMNQARGRCLPMNFRCEDLVGVLKDRDRARELGAGSSLADVEPMNVDSKTSFEDVGGLDHHIRSLKEMVVFPLLYPEVFEKFGISPPRGVLFYGPPGTGKTLVARALANECSKKGQKVAFFMRKGADCLSKWVGESERQLRLLFDQAYSMRPSIIFFDEIDGIAPVRSTRQDQIHSSIVSTLLALMDGLDTRGEIVIIGATNRLDSIDPALRRPGRFDREFLFGLPNRKARQKIIEINTSSWQPKLSKEFSLQLADKCVGYCGADIKALCTEAALFALRRRYPQIYKTSKKLVLDTNEIKISSVDFKNALKSITPASNRSNVNPGVCLPEHLKALLGSYVQKVTEIVLKIFPAGKKILEYDPQKEADISDDESCSIYEKPGRLRQRNTSTSDPHEFFQSSDKKFNDNMVHRPRILLTGANGNGQTCYIAPALLYVMEHLTTHKVDLPALFGTSTRTPEEAIAQVFREARRTAPSIIFLPHLERWWNSINETSRATFITLLMDIPSSIPVFFLTTAGVLFNDLPEEIQDLFSKCHDEVFEVDEPTDEQRYDYFKDLFQDVALRLPVVQAKKCNRAAEILPEASPVKERELSQEECQKLIEMEEVTLRELRLYLRGVTWKLLADRKFKEFSKPVDPEEVDDYLQVIKEPMDLSTVMTRINSHHYNSCAHFLKDIDLITNNCLEYNPDRDQYDKQLRNRACELRDVAYQLVHNDLDPDFEKQCIDIHERRQKAGEGKYASFAPSFLKVLPKISTSYSQQGQPSETNHKHGIPIPDPTGSRFSRRVRGMNDGVLYDPSVLELVDCRRKSGFKVSTKTSENQDSVEQESVEMNVDSQDGMSDESQESDRPEMNGTIADCGEKEKEESSVDRVKRSLEFQSTEPSNKDVTEKMEASRLLSKLVDKTSSHSVQELERIYARICCCLSLKKNEPNRFYVLEMLKELILHL